MKRSLCVRLRGRFLNTGKRQLHHSAQHLICNDVLGEKSKINELGEPTYSSIFRFDLSESPSSETKSPPNMRPRNCVSKSGGTSKPGDFMAHYVVQEGHCDAQHEVVLIAGFVITHSCQVTYRKHRRNGTKFAHLNMPLKGLRGAEWGKPPPAKAGD